VLEGDRLIMPAFGRFTGCAIAELSHQTRAFASTRGRIAEICPSVNRFNSLL
jgi:hypothetical protein